MLPLSHLFADKLTTLGCHTIGVQNDRMDEQVKQFYDILMLTRYGLADLDCSIVRDKYLKRAEEEWTVRKEEGYDLEQVIVDVRKQLLRYEMADSGEDTDTKLFNTREMAIIKENLKDEKTETNKINRLYF